MDDEVDKFLAHFGVKGMHWGSRKSSSSGSTIARSSRSNSSKPGVFRQAYNNSALGQSISIVRGKQPADLRRKATAYAFLGAVATEAAIGAAGAAYFGTRGYGSIKLYNMNVSQAREFSSAAKMFLNRNSKELSNISIITLRKASNGNWGLN